MSQAGPVAEVSGVGAVLFLEGDTGGEIGPNGLGVINIVGAGTITVMGDAATNTLTITDTNVAWTSVSTSQTMVDNMGYFVVAPGGAVVLTLPPTSIQGDVVEIALDGAASFQIAQNAGQSIVYGNQTTTVGATGSLTSLMQGDGVRLVCRIPSQRWVAVSTMGNLVVV
jgi:hypothetical protein